MQNQSLYPEFYSMHALSSMLPSAVASYVPPQLIGIDRNARSLYKRFTDRWCFQPTVEVMNSSSGYVISFYLFIFFILFIVDYVSAWLHGVSSGGFGYYLNKYWLEYALGCIYIYICLTEY